MDGLSELMTPALISSGIRLATPIILAALGGALCNRAGVLNLALEGARTLGLSLPNTATVSDTYTDDSGNSTDISDEDTDTIDVLVDINLSIIKTFDPANVPQGTMQSFTIEVSNAGPSDAVNVSVTDSVNSSLAVTGASVTSGTGDCSASAGQEVLSKSFWNS